MIFKQKIFLIFIWLLNTNCFAAHDVSNVFFQGDSTLMGMKIESSYLADGAFLIETTGARFEYVKGQLKIYQGLDAKNRRLLSTITFDNEPNFVKAKVNNDHILFWSENVNLGIYGDSALTQRIGNVSITVSEYEIVGLTAGQQYRVRVRSLNGTEYGTWSDPATFIANL